MNTAGTTGVSLGLREGGLGWEEAGNHTQCTVWGLPPSEESASTKTMCAGWGGAENVREHVWKLSEGEYLRRTEKMRNDNRKDSHRRTVPKAATSGSVYRFLFSAVERITNVITIYNLVSLTLGGHVACRHSAGAKLSTPSAYPQIRLRHMVCSRQYCYKKDNIDS